jgi:hypothetical protein
MKRAAAPTSTVRPATPPLPADVVRLLQAGLRSRRPERKHRAIEACLAARAFADGFAKGADPERAYRRHVIGPHHEHWLCGYEAGQRAADQAAARYLREQLSPLACALHVDSPTPNAPSSDAPAPTTRPGRAGANRAPRAQPSPQLTLFSEALT